MCGKKELPFFVYLWLLNENMIWFCVCTVVKKVGKLVAFAFRFLEVRAFCTVISLLKPFPVNLYLKNPVREWNCFGWTRCISVFLWKRKVGGGCFRISVPRKSCFPLRYLVAEAVFRFIFYLKASWRIGVASVWPVAVPVFPWEKNGWN